MRKADMQLTTLAYSVWTIASKVWTRKWGPRAMNLGQEMRAQPSWLPTGGGLWAGTWPTEEYEIVNEKQFTFGLGRTCPTEEHKNVNDKQFTSTNLAVPWGQVWGQGLTQLKSMKMSLRNSSLQPIWPTPKGGFGDGDYPSWRTWKLQW
jgi:hypothetical protein